MPKNKDWTGNGYSMKTIGSSSHSENERELNDYYATEPKAVRLLCELEQFDKNIWECACGEGHLSKELTALGYSVFSSDLINRGFGEVMDFLSVSYLYEGDIITNPPYKYAQEFIEQALKSVYVGAKIAMFLLVRFLEGKKRKTLFIESPPKTVHVSSSRLLCAKNADFEGMISGGGSAVAYAWFVWEKQDVYQKDYVTQIKWFN